MRLQNDLEWYDPGQRKSSSCLFSNSFLTYFLFLKLATTKGGALRLTLEKVSDPLNNHNLNYRSGMVYYLLIILSKVLTLSVSKLQTWYNSQFLLWSTSLQLSLFI